MKDTIYVTATYNAEIGVTVQVPREWSVERILEELKGGVPYYLNREDEDYIVYKSIEELIVNGDVIKLDK